MVISKYTLADNFNRLKLLCIGNRSEELEDFLKVIGVISEQANDSCFYWACSLGHTEIVELLLKDVRFNPVGNDNQPFNMAAASGHVDIVKLLLSDTRVDPSTHNNYAIRWASENGHIEVVKILLKQSQVDASDLGNYTIRYACENGYIEIVKILLDELNIVTYRYLISLASKNGHRELAIFLQQKEGECDD